MIIFRKKCQPLGYPPLPHRAAQTIRQLSALSPPQ